MAYIICHSAPDCQGRWYRADTYEEVQKYLIRHNLQNDPEVLIFGKENADESFSMAEEFFPPMDIYRVPVSIEIHMDIAAENAKQAAEFARSLDPHTVLEKLKENVENNFFTVKAGTPSIF